MTKKKKELATLGPLFPPWSQVSGTQEGISGGEASPRPSPHHSLLPTASFTWAYPSHLAPVSIGEWGPVSSVLSASHTPYWPRWLYLLAAHRAVFSGQWDAPLQPMVPAWPGVWGSCYAIVDFCSPFSYPVLRPGPIPNMPPAPCLAREPCSLPFNLRKAIFSVWFQRQFSLSQEPEPETREQGLGAAPLPW